MNKHKLTAYCEWKLWFSSQKPGVFWKLGNTNFLFDRVSAIFRGEASMLYTVICMDGFIVWKKLFAYWYTVIEKRARILLLKSPIKIQITNMNNEYFFETKVAWSFRQQYLCRIYKINIYRHVCFLYAVSNWTAMIIFSAIRECIIYDRRIYMKTFETFQAWYSHTWLNHQKNFVWCAHIRSERFVWCAQLSLIHI